MKKSNLLQVVKWEEQLIKKYELEVAKRLIWHLLVFLMGYTIGLLLLIN